jgi:hypothetical protein
LASQPLTPAQDNDDDFVHVMRTSGLAAAEKLAEERIADAEAATRQKVYTEQTLPALTPEHRAMLETDSGIGLVSIGPSRYQSIDAAVCL